MRIAVPLLSDLKSLGSPALIVAVVLAWFAPWWIGGSNLAPVDLQNRMMSPWRDGNDTHFAQNHIVADCVDQYLVYRLIAERDYQQEGRVGWSSLTYGGTAQNANTMALYFDWTMQLHRFFEFWTAWHLGLIGQVLIAGLGMYAFLKARGIDDFWACCGALAFAANSQFVTWIHHRWTLGAFCWVPWILFAIQLQRKGSPRASFAIPFLLALAFLGGTLQHAALVIIVVIAMWLEHAIEIGKSAWKRHFAHLGLYLAWGICGIGLAGMMFVPCIDAFITSNRLGLHTGMTANAEHSIYPQGWLQPFFNLAAYPLQIFPSLLGKCDSIDLLKLFKSDLFYIFYCGSLPVILGLLAIRRRETPLVARILIIAGLLLPLTPLVRFLYQRLFILFIIGAILAFAHYMTNAQPKEKIRLSRILGICVGAATLIWLAFSTVLLTQGTRLEILRNKIAEMGGGSSFGHFRKWLEFRADQFIGDLFIWSPHHAVPLILLATGLGGLALTASSAAARRQIGSLLVMLAVVGEVTLFAARWAVWSDGKDPLFPQIAESRILQEKVGRNGRVTTVIHPTAHMARTPFVPNTLAPYGIATISGYDSIVPDGMLLPNESSFDARKLGRCGVTHLITWHGNSEIPSDWKQIWSSASMDLYENSHAVPRYTGFPNEAARSNFLMGGTGEFVPLKETTGLENSRTLEIPAGVSWVRIAENHAPGWLFHDADSNQWREVGTAKDKAMWIELSASEKAGQIKMRYQPPMVSLGLSISGVTLAMTMAVAALSFFKRLRQLPPATIVP